MQSCSQDQADQQCQDQYQYRQTKHKTNTHCSINENEYPDSRIEFIYAACVVFGPDWVKE